MARAAFVCGESPAAGFVGEVVVGGALAVLAARRRIAERQHELALLAGIADQRRRQEVGRRLCGGFGVGSETHDHRPLRQIDDFVRGDLLLEFRHDRVAVITFDRVLAELLLLQLMDHRAIVGRLNAFCLGDERRDLLHRIARFHEFQARALDQQFGSDVDADLLELERIQLGRQARVGARDRQHVLAHPVSIVAELLVHRRECGVAAGDLVLVEQLADAGRIGVGIAQRLLDLELGRFQQGGVLEFFLVALTRERGDRRAAGRQADVTLQTVERLGATRRIGLVLQQCLLALEDKLADVGERQQQAFVEFTAFDLPVGGDEHDVDVLADVRVLFGLQILLQRLLCTAQRRALARFGVGAEIGDAVVIAGQAEERGELRREIGLRLQQGLGQFVAALDPLRRRPHGRGGGGFRRRRGVFRGNGGY